MSKLTGILLPYFVERESGGAILLRVPIELQCGRITDWGLWLPLKIYNNMQPVWVDKVGWCKRLTPWVVQTFWAEKLPKTSVRIPSIKRLKEKQGRDMLL